MDRTPHPLRQAMSLLLATLILFGGSIAPVRVSADPGQAAARARAAGPRNLPTERMQHHASQGVYAVAINRYGTLIASAEENGFIRIWDRSTGDELAGVEAHPGAATTDIAFTDSGEFLVSVGHDSAVRVWRVEDLAPVVEIRGHEHPVRTVAFHEQTNLIATAGDETRVMLWDATTGALTGVLSGNRDFIRDLAFSRDGGTLAVAGRDGRVQVWNLAEVGNQPQHTLRGHAGQVNAVAASRDGSRIVSGSDDSTVKVWDGRTGLQLMSYPAHVGAVRELALDESRGLVITAGDDRAIRLWDLETGTPRGELGSGERAINSLLVSPEGSVFAGDDRGGITEWEIEQGTRFEIVPPFLEDWAERSRRLPSEAPGSTERGGVFELLDGFFDWLVPAAAAAELPVPDVGPGGPILVVKSATSPFSEFLPEILRNEGLNAFAVIDVGAMDLAALSAYDVVILAEAPLSAAQASDLASWVASGGNLISLRPDAQLAPLLGLTPAGGTLSEGYLQIDGSGPPGNGIASESMQFHGTADLYTLSGATAVATLFSDASTATPYPAVTLRSVGGAGGQAAAFSFDFAASIVYMRQGNPAWSGQERDGLSPIRSDDMYYGNSATDPQPDWVDLDRAHIPQADEQQRLLANMIVFMMQDRMPLPRFWYLPRGERAAIVMTGDDHSNGGTGPRFDQYILDSEPGCVVEDWECIRGTSYMYPSTDIPPAQAVAYANQGFEVGLHVDTGCANFTESSLDQNYADQKAEFALEFPGVPAPTTQRHHCIVWSDWATGAKVQYQHGVRLDTSYYFWPPSWVDNRPGYFNGSAMVMRFTDLDGSLIDVYQAPTQLTDESGQLYPYTIDQLLDWALGPREFFSVLTVNAHTDFHPIVESDTIVAAAIARDVPVITAHQMLVWLDGRNSSRFDGLAWNGSELTFDLAQDADARGLQTLVPWYSAGGVVSGITRDGSPVAYGTEAVKGVEYARFDSTSGAYVVTYTGDATAPTILSTVPAAGAIDVTPGAPIKARFDEGLDPLSLGATSFELRDDQGTLVAASVGYDALNREAVLTPDVSLTPGSTYTALVRGGAQGPQDLAGNPLAADVQWSFTTSAAPDCPCSVWSETDTPIVVADPDPSGIELGMRFTSDIDGYVTGVRFYKGPGNSGTHVGNLWTASGTRLATGTFTAETSGGWQQLTFSTPQAISAGQVYVVSYFAPNGRYSIDERGFQTSGVDNYPLRVPADGVSGANGLYRYGSSSTFPTDSFDSANYWVDVVFETTLAPDVTPPIVVSTNPTAGTTAVPFSAQVTATLNERLDPASVTPTSFELRDAVGTLVPAAVSFDDVASKAILNPNSPLVELTTYTATLRGGSGGVTDLAGNALPTDQVWSFTTAATPVCPCSGWSDTDVPANPSETDPSAAELGVKFSSYVDGFISGIRFYKGATNTGTHTGSLWTSDGTLLATATFTNETATGWQQVDFAQPVPIWAGAVYVASYHAPNGGYAQDSGYFRFASAGEWPIELLADGPAGGNGVYAYGPGGVFPNNSGDGSNYWVDVVFVNDNGLPPTVSGRSPASGAVDVPQSAFVSATFNEFVDAGTLDATTFELRDSTGALVPGAVTYDDVSATARLTPSADLAAEETYTATMRGGATGVLDLAGAPMTTDVVWSFTTAPPPPCCSVWSDTDVPANTSDFDTNPVELGVKFRSDVSGHVTSVRFYKGANNTGTHVGNLWTATGTLLASATFTNETATGWQRVDFAQPVAISAGTVYVASYHAPNGGYAADPGFFALAGVDAPPLHLLQNGVAGGNGVYAYSATSTFPANSFNAANYWVDVVVQTDLVLTPSVTSTAPASGAPDADATAPITATFSESMDPATVTGANFELRDGSGALVPATVGFDAITDTATLTPAADLAYEATYTATVRGGPTGVLDLDGTPMTGDAVWTFTTAGAPLCCSVWTDADLPANPSVFDPNAVELGVKFTSDVAGHVTAVRFYKGTNNTGTHVGSLWSATGTLLARATFTNETATGWQQVAFDTPVAIAAGTVYVASYHAPNGGYAADPGFFATAGVDNPPLRLLQDGVAGGNGVYAYSNVSAFPTDSWNAGNYWVDVVVETGLTLPPSVTSTDPANGAIDASATAPITATFSESMDPATVTGATFELRDGSGALVPATVGFDAVTDTAMLTPAADLAYEATYTATVRGGPAGVLDLEGAPMTADAVWTFTTAAQAVCCSVWTDADLPSNPSESDPNAVELGVKFTSDVAGYVTAVRFYKGASNTGTHVGSLWSATGTLLARATFTNETATGWQRVDFAQPVAIAAGTVYVASYHAPNGGYAADPGFFATTGVDNPPLRLLQDGVAGGNGVYAYSSASAFPTESWNAGNYWVDVVVETGLTLPPSVTSTDPADGATDVDPTAPITATFSESMDPATVTGATFELRDGSGALVPAVVTYDDPTATFTASATLAAEAVYTARVLGGPTGVKDLTGTPMTADAVFTFTTAAESTCCSAWSETDVPTNPSEFDPNGIELGVKFTSDVAGHVTAVRFYKGANNTGTHVGSLWSATGTLLARATFTDETATGWQEVAFDTPVAIAAGTVYVASYHAPNGGYAADPGFFATTGVYNPPLRLLQDGVAGGNGVYAYSSASAFPTDSWNAGNYWVDVVVATGIVVPPTVTSSVPIDGEIDVDPAITISAVFSQSMDPSSISGSTFELRDAANAVVPAVVAYNAGSNTATLAPVNDLELSSVHTVVIKGGPTGVKDLTGTPMVADVIWTFTTAAQAACCSVWTGADVPANPSEFDPNAVEVGVKFSSSAPGYITGVRFYKGVNNTGIHEGSLWDQSGALLARATFTNETATGWQQVDFSIPVAISANTTYVASYHAPNGGYAADSEFFAASGVDNPPLQFPPDGGAAGGNGVFAYSATPAFPNGSFSATNYWVDVVYRDSNGSAPPTIDALSPENGANDVPANSVVTATFNDFMNGATIDSTSFELRDSTSALVAGTVTYDAPTRTASLDPSADLQFGETYTARLRGGLILALDGDALAADVSWTFTAGGEANCIAPANAIVAENCLIGSPASQWDIVGNGDPSIQGYATDISVDRGTTVDFKIDTTAAAYTIDIYRMGYYAGLGARRVATIAPSATLPQVQPACDEDPATGLIDCAAWSVSASWNVPANAVSGIYFAKLTRTDTGGASHVFFVVRDDTSTSKFLFQTSDTTWQAYNNYGGNSLYTGQPVGRAYAVSYNRPFYTREVDGGQDWVFNTEYPTVRWLEANGYDVSYFTGVDADRLGSLIQNHEIFLSVGHDEYWSAGQRSNVEAARDAGVHLAFLSGNEIFWKTRWEDGHRTLVCYKETHANAIIDPASPIWTGTWRDPRFSPPTDGGQPENALTGTIFTVNAGATTSISVPQDYSALRFWRNTSVATLAPGTAATLPFGTLGYEWDSDLDNGFRPAGLIRLSSTVVPDAPVLVDFGSTYQTGPAEHNLTLYRAPSGALVFGAGTVQWAWGLDEVHDRAGTPSDVRMQQAMVNLFADMGAQPETLQTGLVPAVGSTDVTPPTSTVGFPANGATLAIGVETTITGTSADTGGGVVGGVEVSVDGGATWRRADGWGSWSYTWTPDQLGATSILSRAADDSANLGAPSTPVNVTVE